MITHILYNILYIYIYIERERERERKREREREYPKDYTNKGSIGI
jgi:hypothetical protein